MIFKPFHIIILALFISCASNPVSETLNNWKKQQNSRYWYGIAIIDKKNIDLNIQNTARNEAIADIASQIKIKIKQDFKKNTEENNYEIKEYSKRVLESQIDNNLEEVEIIDYKDLGDTYMLYARLSKEKYYSKIKMKRENAKKVALEYISKASYPSAEAFRYLYKAESEILKYIDYPISVFYNNKSQDLYSLIQSLKEGMLNRISIETNEYNKNIKSLIPTSDFVTFRVFDLENNKPVSNIPLFSKINDGLDYCTTDINGECDFYINKKFISKDLRQYIYVGFNQAELYGYNPTDNYSSLKVDINLIPVSVYLEVDEYNLNNKTLHPYIKPAIKEFLMKEFNLEFSNNKSDSDLLFYVNVNTSSANENPNEYGIYQVFGNATIDVKLKNQQESILSLAINNIQGASFNSANQAGEKSLQNIRDKIFNETLVELVSILQQN